MKLSSIILKLKNEIFRSKVDSRYGIGYLEQKIFNNWFNPFLSFWINFRSLPLKQAMKFPIWVFGRPRLYCLSGRIIINDEVKSGMIKFNIVNSGAPGNMTGQSELLNLGIIEFNGSCKFGTGNKIIVSYGKKLQFGKNCRIMNNCTIAVHERICIGQDTIIAHSCQILDTNFHFTADLEKKRIGKRTKPVIIGEYCWICNSSSIMPGSVIPNYAIIGSQSMVNKDFSNYSQGCIIAGTPAKLIREGIVRVFNPSIENKIWAFWKNNNLDYFPLNDFTLKDLL